MSLAITFAKVGLATIWCVPAHELLAQFASNTSGVLIQITVACVYCTVITLYSTVQATNCAMAIPSLNAEWGLAM